MAAISDMPAPKPVLQQPCCPKLDPYKSLIDQWLMDDKKAPRKRRHTAKRVYVRLTNETEDFECSYRLVADYVKKRKSNCTLKTKTKGKSPSTITRVRHSVTSVLPIFMRMVQSIPANTLCAHFHTAIRDFISCFMGKTWNVCWNHWMPSSAI